MNAVTTLNVGQLYNLTKRQEQLFYAGTRNRSKYENSVGNIIYKNDIHYEYIIEDDIEYRLVEHYIGYAFVYEEDDINYEQFYHYIKDMEQIITINSFNDLGTIDLTDLIIANKTQTDVIVSMHQAAISHLDGLTYFQSEIQASMFTCKYGTSELLKLQKETIMFNIFCDQLPKSDSIDYFYVFRRQRLSATYDPCEQYNNGNFEKYILPFSTSTSYDFVKEWSDNGVILVIKVPFDFRYMALYNQSQCEITLAPCTLNYINRGMYNNQAIIICDIAT